MDKIIAAVPFRDYVLVFTETGTVYKVLHDALTNTVKVILETRINLERF